MMVMVTVGMKGVGLVGGAGLAGWFINWLVHQKGAVIRLINGKSPFIDFFL
jgi:hypothetical protein